jgi:class 3 adenylate cyclase
MTTTYATDTSKKPVDDKELLKQLLMERNEFPERKDDIDTRIKQAFEREVAIMILDMCGFSRTVLKYGIIHYLAMIAQMEELATPAIEDNGGTVIKQEADNIFATFPTVEQAVNASLDIFRAFRAADTVLPTDRDIYGSIGIGYGPTLVIDNHDMFGNEMNLASKLGEDLAESMEILLTSSAGEALLAQDKFRCETVEFSISGLELNCYRLVQNRK